MKKISKEFIRKNKGCYTTEQLENCSFMKSKNEVVDLLSIIYSEIPLKDKFWFICKKIATKKENQQIAVKCAEIVLPIYEKQYPNNKALREAIEATKLYIITGNISLKTLLLKRKAAENAADAAYAETNDAESDSEGAYAETDTEPTYSDADSAYYAADAAYYAANAAYDAVADTAESSNYITSLFQILIDYEKDNKLY